MKIVQISDIHVDPFYKEGSPTECNAVYCCRDTYTGTKAARTYGEHVCSTPMKTVDLMLRSIGEHKPEFVIMSGDNPNSHMWAETWPIQLNGSQIVVEAFKRVLPDVTVYPNVGNHETFPGNLFDLGSEQVKRMFSTFTDWWTPLAKFEEGQKQTFRKAGYFTVLVKPGLRLLSYNSNFGHTMNFYALWNDRFPVIEEMNAFVRATLADARKNNEKVLVVSHQPPGDDSMIVTFSRMMEPLMAEYSDIIVLQVAGHTHNDQQKLIRDKDGVPKSVVHISSSIAPTSGGGVNPSYRVYYLDASTHQLVDYEDYVLDLAKQDKPKVELGYSARKEYGMSGLTPADYDGLAKRILKDDEIAQKYHKNFHAGLADLTPVDHNTRVFYHCYLRHFAFDEQTRCVKSLERPEAVMMSSGETKKIGLVTMTLAVVMAFIA